MMIFFVTFVFAHMADNFIQCNLQLRQDMTENLRFMALAQGSNHGVLLGFELTTFRSVTQCSIIQKKHANA